MFWILKIFPHWFWWLMLVAGLSGYFLAQLPQLKLYRLPIKIVGLVLVATSIFVFGLQHADNRWQQAAQELQAKVQVAEAESKTANAQIETKVVTRTQVVKQKGETVVRYIDRETVKIDERCTIPPEFVNAHNQAATK
jgi:energy-coupling factor transporter transmembrane protein EcfT